MYVYQLYRWTFYSLLTLYGYLGNHETSFTNTLLFLFIVDSILMAVVYPRIDLATHRMVIICFFYYVKILYLPHEIILMSLRAEGINIFNMFRKSHLVPVSIWRIFYCAIFRNHLYIRLWVMYYPHAHDCFELIIAIFLTCFFLLYDFYICYLSIGHIFEALRKDLYYHSK